MALKTFVKVSGVNNLSDARYCAGMGVNQLGFNVENNHPNFTDPQSFKELSDWVSGVAFVAEIESLESKGQLAQLIENYEVDAIQVSHAELINEAAETGKEVVYFASSLADAQKVAQDFQGLLSYILLEDESAESGSLATMAQEIDLIIASGFDADSVENVLELAPFKGIALKGSDEIRPGFKDFDQMADILEALDADEWA